jgi:membrane protein DedA with SNARE-associated domain
MHLVYGVLERYGDFAAFGLVFLAAAYVPIPSSLIIVIAGALTGVGELPLGLTFASVVVAAVLGDSAGYDIARALTGRTKWRQGTQRHRSLARLDGLL